MQNETESKRIEQEAPLIGTRLEGKYMTFKLATEEYGLEILNVREIIGLMEITKVPKTQEALRGVINLRGKVIPVIDLRLKFGMPSTETTDQTVIIVVQYKLGEKEITMGILVDEVLEVLNVTADKIEPPPILGTGTSETDFILGIGKTDERVIFLLNISKVLHADETIEISTLSAPEA